MSFLGNALLILAGAQPTSRELTVNKVGIPMVCFYFYAVFSIVLKLEFSAKEIIYTRAGVQIVPIYGLVGASKKNHEARGMTAAKTHQYFCNILC